MRVWLALAFLAIASAVTHPRTLRLKAAAASRAAVVTRAKNQHDECLASVKTFETDWMVAYAGINKDCGQAQDSLDCMFRGKLADPRLDLHAQVQARSVCHPNAHWMFRIFSNGTQPDFTEEAELGKPLDQGMANLRTLLDTPQACEFWIRDSKNTLSHSFVLEITPGRRLRTYQSFLNCYTVRDWLSNTQPQDGLEWDDECTYYDANNQNNPRSNYGEGKLLSTQEAGGYLDKLQYLVDSMARGSGHIWKLNANDDDMSDRDNWLQRYEALFGGRCGPDDEVNVKLIKMSCTPRDPQKCTAAAHRTTQELLPILQQRVAQAERFLVSTSESEFLRILRSVSLGYTRGWATAAAALVAQVEDIIRGNNQYQETKRQRQRLETALTERANFCGTSDRAPRIYFAGHLADQAETPLTGQVLAALAAEDSINIVFKPKRVNLDARRLDDLPNIEPITATLTCVDVVTDGETTTCHTFALPKREGKRAKIRLQLGVGMPGHIQACIKEKRELLSRKSYHQISLARFVETLPV